MGTIWSLFIVAVKKESGHVELFEIFREVRLREGLDAVVEGEGNVLVKLRSIFHTLGSQVVENLDRSASRIHWHSWQCSVAIWIAETGLRNRDLMRAYSCLQGPIAGCSIIAKRFFSLGDERELSKNSDISMTKQEVDLCVRLKAFGFAQGNQMKLYGEEFELVSEPFFVGDNLVLVDAIETKSGRLRRVRIPLPVLKMANRGSMAA